MKRKESRIEIRVAPSTLRDWKRAAKRDDVSLSEWIRRQCKPVVRVSPGAYRIRWNWAWR